MVDIKRKLAIANNRINLKLHDILLPDYAHIRHIPQQLDIKIGRASCRERV